MKNYTLLKATLLLLVATWIMPSAFAQNRKIQELTEQNTLFGIPGSMTVRYYLNEDGDPIPHGKTTFDYKFDNTKRRSPGEVAKRAKIDGYVEYKDGGREGKLVVNVDLNNNKGKVDGQCKDNLMAGTWNVVNLDGASNIKEATFTIKDRRIVNARITFSDGTKVVESCDAQGRLTELIIGKKKFSFKNGVVLNEMKYKSGIESSDLTPQAKAMLEQLAKREVLGKELVENGFCLETWNFDELGIGAYDMVEKAMESYSELVPIDKDLNKPTSAFVLCQIKDSQWASFEQCKKLLDEEQKNNGFSAMDDLADSMIGSYEDGKGHYLKPEVVQAIEDYKSTAKEQWFVSTKKTINGMNDIASLFSFVEKVSNDIMAFPVEKQRELDNAIDAKYTDLVAKMKKNVEEEMDYVALVNFYNSNVEPVKKDMADSDARSIDASYQKRRGELEKTVSAKIVDEMSRKESSKDLKEYYNSVQNVVESLPSNSSTIRSTYDNKYAELVRKEEKAERKAARRSKVIKTLEWVGVGVAVVGGYLIYKYVLPEKE